MAAPQRTLRGMISSNHMHLILRWLAAAITLLLLTMYLPGIAVASFYAALVAALALGLINALIRPLILLFTLPINILTLGLFTLLINALLFWFAATLVKGFSVAGFWPAFWGALILSVEGWFVSRLLK